LNLLTIFEAAYVFAQSNLSGSWQWNLLGRFETALADNESLESNESNECHVLFVSFIIIIYCFHFLIFYLFVKCLPKSPSFSSGSSYPPSTHVSESRSASMSRYALSESHSHSRPDTPMDVSVPSGSGRTIDENLLGRLKAAGLTINESLCYDTNPTLQVMYQRYTHIHDIQAQIADMVAEHKWLTKFGKYPNKTEIIGLFVAKTTWHNSYAKVFPMVDSYEHMLAWLEGDPDAKSDLDLWGVTKSKYSIADLGEWLKKQKGKKVVKSVTKFAVKSAKGAKEKEKEKKQGSGSGAGKGNKQKGVEPEQADNKKSHKKKKVTGSG
jgi:hypothetical protein